MVKIKFHLWIKGALAVILIGIIAYGLWWWQTDPHSGLYNKGEGEDPALVGVIEGTRQASLKGAMGTALDLNGNLYIANGGTDTVIVLNGKGKLLRTIGKDEQGRNLLKFPTSVAVGPKGQVYVANFGGGGVLIFDNQGRLQDRLPLAKDRTLVKELKPLALAADSEGNVYAADGEQHKVFVFDAQGNLKLAFGGKGSERDQFSFINGLVVDEKNRRLIIVDSNNLRLSMYNYLGRLIRNVSYKEKGANLLVAPRGIAWDPVGEELYLVDALKDSILVLKDDGRLIAEFGYKSLDYPIGIARDKQGYLYVTNRERNRISVFKQ